MFLVEKRLVVSILGVFAQNGVLGVWGTLGRFGVFDDFDK